MTRDRRKEELINYVDLLKKLIRDGFKCEKELNQALKELHMLMLEEKPETTLFIFEKDFNGVTKSIDTFKNILYDAKIESRMGDSVVMKSGNTFVHIIKIDDYTSMPDRFRGFRPNYIINNTGKDISKIV